MQLTENSASGVELGIRLSGIARATQYWNVAANMRERNGKRIKINGLFG